MVQRVKVTYFQNAYPKYYSLIYSGADKLYHPTVQFAEDNVSFSINTGYPAVTGTGMEAEIDLVKFWGLTETHLTKAVFNSARNAFMEDKKKKELQKELRKVIGYNVFSHSYKTVS